ncbi:hypothetical protein [Nocardia alni]|uniref:hypothetical protein n=1 Tax=Nocardia alni TaxID=2815723 RepID=UPI001C2282D8|nr:hypothetical protein [Nocardia alni]
MIDGIDPNDWKNLLTSANAGELFLDPETGKGLDKVCDDHIAQIREALIAGSRVSYISGFGNFNSSQTLEKKFSALASGDNRSLEAILKQHIDAANTAKQVVAKAIANYEALDENHRHQIEKLTPQ